MTLEQDEVEILGGVRFGRTLGSPVAVVVRNTEWPKWREQMAPEPGEGAGRKLTAPRPGHADLAGMIKYDTHDARDILERASARETAARTIAGYLAKVMLGELGIEIVSHVVAIGDAVSHADRLPTPADLDEIDDSPVRAFDREAERAMVEAIEAAQHERDTLGGVVEVIAYGVPPGIGSHVHHDRKLDGLLAGALMSIPAIKGVEVGDGFESAARRGTEAHDEIYHESGAGYHRKTNRAGGTEGGMTIGDVLRVRAAMKPISTVMQPLDTVDVVTRKPERAFRERSDVCAVPAAGVVAEQMVAIVLAQELQRKLGGDTIGDMAEALDLYRKRIASF
jgi:chorismate synthase